MHGLAAVYKKELQDQLSSYRFVILFALIAMVSFITSYMAAVHLRENLETLSATRFPFLMLFSTPGVMFSMIQFVAFFGPLIGIVSGFDAINRERSQGTLIKVIAQPVYRDAVINGKFLAGVTTVALMFTAILLVISGFGLAVVGVVPGVEEILRLFIYLVVSIFYIAFWLALSILFSILFKSMATSALASVALWIFLSFFVSLGAEVAADMLVPIDRKNESTPEEVLRHVHVQEAVSLFSPMVLYSNATATIIDPMRKTTRSFVLMGPLEELLSARFRNPLTLGQSLLIVLPHMLALVAITVICFAISYTIFMLQEVRT
ncbi:MAG: ABC transporter permease subunit [Deltaproteobacteria bacterium]|nr:ABC transporter permease subunit [Deltaproteobacteria bacterium]